jgi:hypothetical protein
MLDDDMIKRLSAYQVYINPTEALHLGIANKIMELKIPQNTTVGVIAPVKE